ncbi:MAG TPA: amidohydrolase [Chthoniobacterales bacterium]|nr:amidohydrolase [Chthoniobacterales bacterium]
MKKLLLIFILLPGLPPRSPAEPADTILLNGSVHTVNEKAPEAEAIVIKGERILFVGSNVEAKKYSGSATRTIDLKGKTVVPGFTDSHYHIFGVGHQAAQPTFDETTSRSAMLARVKQEAEDGGGGKWITGRGWIETFWKPSTFLTREELDKVAPANPVFLERTDGHGAVANSKALELAGIDAKTPDPFGGKILRDEETGEPTGMLLDNAMDLVAQKIPPISPEEKGREFLLGVQRTLALGWCEIQNAGSELPDLALMRKFYEEGKVKLRIYNAVYGPGAAAEKILKDGPILDAYDHHFTTRTIKVIFDGSLGSRSAALLAPYSDAETSGFLTQKEEDLRPMFREALRRGIQVETHAIGDRANRTILDLYEEAFKAVPPDERKVKEPRWRVEHAQILAPNDIPRFARLGVIASMQPSHAISDLFFAPARLGEKRLAGVYAWQSLLKSGAIIAAGSDAPVEKGDPMIEFYAAVARQSKGGLSKPDWHPEEAVSRAQALEMLTRWPAYAAFQEKEKGSIEAGKLADLTILSEDIMKIPKPEILRTRCLMTVIGGEIVYDTGELP